MFELAQYSDLALLLLRLTVGIIFVYHSLPKLKNASAMAQMVGMGKEMVFVLGAVEFLSAFGIILGLYLQISAIILAVVMIGAIAMKMMKWYVPFAAMDKTGWEFDLILLAANIVILVIGGGTISIQ